MKNLLSLDKKIMAHRNRNFFVRPKFSVEQKIDIKETSMKRQSAIKSLKEKFYNKNKYSGEDNPVKYKKLHPLYKPKVFI